MDSKIKEEFKNPGSIYRGAPFWAWNGKLEPEELRWQIRIMNKMGLGGFFMHSRVGLDTPYLSEEWFECVKACIDEAEKLDMQAWLYDEDRWPSGAAGGLVTKNEEYRRRSLLMEEIDKPEKLKSGKETIAVFIAEFEKDKLTKYKKISASNVPAKLAKNEIILRFYVKIDECSSWYNNQTYLDTLSHDAVKEFIKVTHEAYRKNIAKDFGGRVPGIFTDEPNFRNLFTEDENDSTGIAWTKSLPETFKKRYGYDIIEKLPEIFIDMKEKEISQPRYHYCECVTFLFVDAFGRQIGEWCDKNKMMHTGHLLHEDNLSSQTGLVGDCMRFYEYMQAPGIDQLTEHRRLYDTVKQVSSVAHQFGKKWRLTEAYGCTGWDFSFEGQKAVGDWQAALGINIRCQHLSWYTMQGQAKRDYPASIFYQSPWWESYSKVEDYFARIHAVMTNGEEIRDLLVLHPVESMWTMTGKKWRETSRVKNYDKMFIQLRDMLLDANIDFDYGNEEIIAKYAKSKSGKFIIGKAEYKAILVPQLKTMRSSTLKALKGFKDAGGLVIFIGKPTKHIDALPSDEAVKFAKACESVPFRSKEIIASLESTTRRVSIATPDGNEIKQALYLLREDKDCSYIFICNTGHDKVPAPEVIDHTLVRDRRAEFPEVIVKGFKENEGSPLELDLESGEIYKADASGKNGEWIIKTSLPRVGSRMFAIPKKKDSGKAQSVKKLKTVATKKLRNKKWDITLSEDNVLTLDWPSFRIDGGAWQKADEILRVDKKAKEAIGAQPRGGQMVQPWAREKKTNPKSACVELEYAFNVEAIPSGALHLAIEMPKTFEISINGVPVNSDVTAGWWCDKSLKKLPVNPNILKIGENKLHLKCNYDENHPGFEIVYLLGSFGIKKKKESFVMTPCAESLQIGDWVKQGLTFYSGSVSYRANITADLKKGERMIVKLPAYRGALAKIYVNGTCAGSVAWEPNEVDISDFLNKGKNSLSIEIIAHRRNSHGPFHLNKKWPDWTGPAQFQAPEESWIDNYQLVPCGLMKEPELLIKK